MPWCNHSGAQQTLPFLGQFCCAVWMLYLRVVFGCTRLPRVHLGGLECRGAAPDTEHGRKKNYYVDLIRVMKVLHEDENCGLMTSLFNCVQKIEVHGLSSLCETQVHPLLARETSNQSLDQEKVYELEFGS